MALSVPGVGDYNYNSDLVEDLNKAIGIYHDAFIAEDDLEKQRRTWSSLQENAEKYLCLVPHNRKFKFKETERILQESINSLKDFNPKKASYAFECLVKYGYNLITQPWRRDFHTIKVTSGFYVHNVSSNLKNAQEILIAMGYVNILDNSLKLVPNYELSTVKDVSRDCILACQECLILSKMMEHVSYEEPNYSFKFEKLYDVRCKNKGDIAEMCKSVLNEVRRSRPNKAIKNTLPLNAKELSNNKSSVGGSEDHFYDDVSAGDNITSISSSPSTRRSKSMVFETSTPKRVPANPSEKKHLLAYKEEKCTPNKGETLLNGSLTPRTSSNARNQHVYQNVPYLRRNNDTHTHPSKSSLNREKTKWHTPMKNKLNPQKHLKLTKLSEQEIEFLANESDSEDTKEESGYTKSSNSEKDKSISDDNKNVQGANKPFSGNIGDKCGPDLISGVTGVMQYAKDFSAALFAKSSAGKPPSNSTQGYSKYYEDEVAQSVVATPVKNSKSSYSPSSPYDGSDFTSICGKEGSTVSSTVASSSSWDMKLRSGKEINKRVPPEEHFYDEPPFSDNSANNKNAISKNSQSSTLVNGSPDPSLYYENVEYSAESVGLGFGHSKKNNNSQSISRNPKNSTYLTCKNSLKSQQDEIPSDKASKKREKLEDLEDVWLNTLLTKGEKFNYLEPQGNNMILDDCSTETDSNISGTADVSTVRYDDDDGYDGDTSESVDNLLKRNNQMKPMNNKTSKQVRESEFANKNSKGKSSEKKLSFDPWNCKFCTFFNTSNELICEICCKSKDNMEDDDDLIAVGDLEVARHSKAPSLPDFMGEDFMTSSPISSSKKSKQITCSQCTLLNIPTARLCDACGFRLDKYSSPSRTSWLEDIGRDAE